RPRPAPAASAGGRGSNRRGSSIGMSVPGASIQIPLTVTVSVGTPVATGPARSSPRGGGDVPHSDSAEIDDGNEAVAEDYRDRGGYRADFLGEDAVVALPMVDRNRADVLKIDADESGGNELRYEHFSVVMSSSRRMCFFSAVNID